MNEQLQAEIQAIEDELSQLTSNTEQWMVAKRKLEDLKKQAASAEAQEEVFNQFENISFGEGITIALRELCKDEDSYQLVSAFVQSTVGDMAEKNTSVVASYISEIESKDDEIAELSGYKSEANRLGDLLADMTAKRDAAGEEIQNAKEEIERLTADNESLRKQLEAKPATKPNIDAAELIKKIQAAKPGIYNKRWKINEKGLEDRRYYTANLSETGEEIDIPLLENGKYREETPEQAETFRQAKAAEEAAKLAQEAAESVSVPDLTFQQDEEPIGGMGGDTTHAQVVGETVTRAEFEEVKARLARVEGNYELGKKVAV